jgi:hypothetical protein
MRSKNVISTFVLLFVMAACNLPEGGPVLEVVPTDTIQPLFTETPTETLIPTETPLPTLTPTPTIPIAWPSDKGVNCRLGPGIEWVTVGALLVGETATIQGRNIDSSWWYAVTAGNPGSPCWVAASVTLTAGNLANLAIINPPIASVTKVTLKLDPKEINLPSCLDPFPEITIKGTIETNGPVKVDYYFATESGGDMPADSTNFKGADSKSVETAYTPPPGAGSFWVRLIISGPNDKVGEAKYKIVCS